MRQSGRRRCRFQPFARRTVPVFLNKLLGVSLVPVLGGIRSCAASVAQRQPHCERRQYDAQDGEGDADGDAHNVVHSIALHMTQTHEIDEPQRAQEHCEKRNGEQPGAAFALGVYRNRRRNDATARRDGLVQQRHAMRRLQRQERATVDDGAGDGVARAAVLIAGVAHAQQEVQVAGRQHARRLRERRLAERKHGVVGVADDLQAVEVVARLWRHQVERGPQRDLRGGGLAAREVALLRPALDEVRERRYVHAGLDGVSRDDLDGVHDKALLVLPHDVAAHDVQVARALVVREQMHLRGVLAQQFADIFHVGRRHLGALQGSVACLPHKAGGVRPRQRAAAGVVLRDGEEAQHDGVRRVGGGDGARRVGDDVREGDGGVALAEVQALRHAERRGAHGQRDEEVGHLARGGHALDDGGAAAEPRGRQPLQHVRRHERVQWLRHGRPRVGRRRRRAPRLCANCDLACT
ncbi:hypothetical protein FGB62_60g111 [Gracilaria domingensis]|nr:hypothetical protein FGB62_60g111 [Gracilaria domingensis]